ncbi:MAG: DUF2779 domain-containing protein [Solobacterium sp.]|nr:DUF2779 domain-containing protein [Solobacterium sp.]
MYHISDCRKYIRCPHLFVYKEEAESSTYIPFVRLDESMTELVKKRLGITDCFEGKRGDEASLALQALSNSEWLVNARFEHDRLRVKMPFMHKNEEGWDLYFLFTGLFPRGDNLLYYTSTVWVLEHNGILIKDIRIVHLNGDYVRGEHLDPMELLQISDQFYTSRNHPSGNVRDRIYKALYDMTGLLDEMDACSKETLPPAVRTSRCTTRSRCSAYESCFPEETAEEDSSVLFLTGSSERYAMKKEGILRMKDVPSERIEGLRIQYAEILADCNGGLFADRLALKNWLSSIHYPVTFLDFEWDTFAVPPYEGMKPYDVLPFEYSVHILDEDGTLTHKIFLSENDCRREMAEALLRDIPETGSLIAYNAEGAEKIRLGELAAQFSEYRDRLLDMADRMEDLQLPFESGMVYDLRMRGQWSLKTIMAMMDAPGYSDLDIREGMQAVLEWRTMENDTDAEEKEKIRNDLEAYCGMDTYAMTVVLDWLRKLV